MHNVVYAASSHSLHVLTFSAVLWLVMEMFRPKWQRWRGDIASIVHFKDKKCTRTSKDTCVHLKSLLCICELRPGLFTAFVEKPWRAASWEGLLHMYSVWGQWAMSQARRHSYDLPLAHSLPALWNSNIQVEEWQHLTTLCIVNRKRERGRNREREQLWQSQPSTP